MNGYHKDCVAANGTSGDTLITGIAQHSKAGAVVITDSGQVYYVEGKNDWDDDGFFKSIIRVCGTLKIIHTSKEELGYNDEVYKQGIIGEQFIIFHATWKKASIDPANIPRDAILKRLGQTLPDNWKITFNTDTMIVKRQEPVYSLYENQINAPINKLSHKEQEDRIIKYGKQIYPCFEFLLVPRFSEREIKAMQSANEQILDQIRLLPKKHNIDHLAHSRKGRTYFVTNTDDEKKAVDAYENDKNKLMNRMIRLHDYHSELFSLFLLKEEGMHDEFTLIHPSGASVEMWKIRSELLPLILIKP